MRSRVLGAGHHRPTKQRFERHLRYILHGASDRIVLSAFGELLARVHTRSLQQPQSWLRVAHFGNDKRLCDQFCYLVEISLLE